MRNLKAGEFLDYFRDGVNGLGIREQAVGDGGDDVEGALQELTWVCAVQLPGPEHAFDAVPGERSRETLVFFLNMNVSFCVFLLVVI